MFIKEVLKELKEIRRAIGIVFLAVLTFLGNILNKYLENPENLLLKKALILILLSIPIWRTIKNGQRS